MKTATPPRSHSALVREAVRALFARGLRPIPVTFRTKKPAAGVGWNHVTRDQFDLDREFPPDRALNVGCLNGTPSGNVVDVDLDCLEARLAAPILLPPTGMVWGRASAPDSHYGYRVDAPPRKAEESFDDPTAPRSAGHLAEIRSDGGHTLYPPSVAPADPKKHKVEEPVVWHRDGEPAAVSVGDLRAAVGRVAAAALLGRFLGAGRRHDPVLALAGGLLRAGWQQDDVLTLVRAVAAASGGGDLDDLARCVTDTAERLKDGKDTRGWPKLARLLGEHGEAVVRQVRVWLGARADPRGPSEGPAANRTPSAEGWPAAIPLGTAPDVPAFPVDVLSPWVAEYASAQANELQVPVDLPALLAVGFVAGGIGRKVVAHVRDGFTEPGNLFVMPVLPPGERKTQTFAKAAAPIQALEREAREAPAPAITDAESDFRIAEGRVKNLEGRIARSDDPGERECLRADLRTARDEMQAIDVPPEPLWYTEDDTPDSLKAELIKQGGRMMVASTEAKCLENISQYDDKPNFDVYLKGHGGDELRVGRVSRGRSSVTDPALTCVLSPQPAVLEGLAENAALRGRGFLARWLYAIPASRVGYRAVAAAAVPRPVRDRYHAGMRAVWSISYAEDDSGGTAAHVVRFSPEAERAFRDFEAWVEPQLAPGNRLASLAGWGNKLTGACVRVATGLHVADAVGTGSDWRVPVPAETVRRAIRLCGDYLIPHALAAFALMGANPTLTAARRVWKWIVDSGRETFTKRDCFNALRAWFDTVDGLQPALDLLDRHFLIRPLASERPGPGRKPSPVYEVNPRAGEGDAPGPDGDPDRPSEPSGDPGRPKGGCAGGSDPLDPNSAYCAHSAEGPRPTAASDPLASSKTGVPAGKTLAHNTHNTQNWVGGVSDTHCGVNSAYCAHSADHLAPVGTPLPAGSPATSDSATLTPEIDAHNTQNWVGDAQITPFDPNSAYCAHSAEQSAVENPLGPSEGADSPGGITVPSAETDAQNTHNTQNWVGGTPHPVSELNSAYCAHSAGPFDPPKTPAEGGERPSDCVAGKSYAQNAHNTQNCRQAAPSPERGLNSAHSARRVHSHAATGPTGLVVAQPVAVESGSDGELVVTVEAVNALAADIAEWGAPVALDTETTGLDPERDRVRLIQLCVNSSVFVVDAFALPEPTSSLAALFAALKGVEVVGHNLQFDLRFLAKLGFVPGRVFCTMLASQILHAGERDDDTNGRLKHSLAVVLERELGVTLDKHQQKSDWSRPMLTPEQLQYAARDVQHLLPLADRLKGQLAAANLTATADLEMRALLGIASAVPVAVDGSAWSVLARTAESERVRLAEAMDSLAPNRDCLPGTESRNWNSPEEVKAAFRDLDISLTSTDDDTLADVDHPLAGLVREFRAAAKRAGTYGLGWLDEHAPNGFVLPSWNQLGAQARMSCSSPNLQQIPRGVAYRKCFVARPGRVLVKADYSQIELRVAAVVAKESRMIAAYAKGEDLHTLTAAALTGKPVADVQKGDRQLAKAVNFGLLYGMGWRSLGRYAASNYGVTLSDDEAKRYRTAFFRSYPGLKTWHAEVEQNLKNALHPDPDVVLAAWTRGGRRRLIPAAKRDACGTAYPNKTEHLNFPVQGTAADGMKAVIAMLWERRDECPGAVPVLFVHDEIVVEVPETDADAAKDWLVTAMVDGMQPLIPGVPVVVEATVAKSWGG